MTRISLSTAGITILFSMLAGGCNTPPDGDPVADPDPSATLTREVDNQVVRATRVSDTLLTVDVLSREGAVLFALQVRPKGEPDGLTWRIPPSPDAVETAAVSSGSMPSEFEQLPSLADGIDAALYVQLNVANAANGREYDNWGCDLPFHNVASCSSKGACCDIHDACYARFRCSSSSWINPFASLACKGCNAAVVACFAAGNPGPSVCCRLGNCGRPR